MNNPFVTLNIPVLETPRLILRGPARADFEAMLAMFSDPGVTEHLWGDQSREDVWGRLLRSMGGWAVAGYGMFAVVEKSSGAYAGILGCFEAKRGIDPRFEEMPEAGWILGSAFHGKGYATEAMQAVLAWTDTAFKTPVYCMVEPGNARSIRVSAKLGFEPWFTTQHKGDAVAAFLRPAPAKL